MLGSLYTAQSITVIGTSGDWLAVSYNGTTAYISAAYLSQTPPATTTTTAAPVTQPPVQSQETAAPTEAYTETAPALPDDTQEAAAIETPEQTTDAIPAMVTENSTEETTAASSAKETKETTQTEKPAAVGNENNKNGGGTTGLIIALGSALGTFLLIGVLPVVIHKIHHNNIYQY